MKMTDRELLELAAKANWADELADTSIRWCDADQCILYIHADNQDHNGADREFRWDPLNEDADALRLAVKLAIEISPCPATDSVMCEPKSRPDSIITVEALDDYGTRRAIVRAAAEIGKAMRDEPCHQCRGEGRVGGAAPDEGGGKNCGACDGTGLEVNS